ncbi:MAG: Trk family potassium uptake protein [Clostridia bacterium]|nr:Trk family potassium uptake protein [Clostridia bacterium]
MRRKRIKQVNRDARMSFRIITGIFLCLVLAGALLLMLPFSSREFEWTSFTDALFTAISASCVTGLIVKDTATYWSEFGQAVIILLIQIGGMGVITIGIAIMKASGKKISLGHRSLMMNSISAHRVGGMVSLVKFIIRGSLIIELIGALLFMTVFCRDFGFKGIWYSVFHSISAFCNAGFDLMGVREPFSSLTSYSADVIINTGIMLLIIIGGIGFMTWGDVRDYKYHIRRYSMQSKIILVTSFFLILIPAVYFYFAEYSSLPTGERVLNSLFQSVTTRTAGFNTSDLTKMSDSGITVMIILMLIGGSPGSTAGGMKTTTFAVLFLAAIAVFSRRNDVNSFGRRISHEAIRNAGAVLFMYFTLFIAGGIAISTIENLPILTCLFETSSAVGTVGLTLGITSGLSVASKVILMALMFFGRVGGLTLIYAAVPSGEMQQIRYPLEKVTVG